MQKSYPEVYAQNLMCSFQLLLLLHISSFTHNSLHFWPYLILKPVVVSLTTRLKGEKPTFPCCITSITSENELVVCYPFQIQMGWSERQRIMNVLLFQEHVSRQETLNHFLISLFFLLSYFPQVVAGDFCKEKWEIPDALQETF